MIAAISGPTSAPAPVLPLPPSVARVAAVEPATSGVGIGADSDGGRRPSAGPAQSAPAQSAPAQSALAVGAPPEPLSTASVLLLRQNGSSLSGIADAYGISVDAVRRLLHADDAPTPVSASALQAAAGAA